MNRNNYATTTNSDHLIIHKDGASLRSVYKNDYHILVSNVPSNINIPRMIEFLSNIAAVDKIKLIRKNYRSYGILGIRCERRAEINTMRDGLDGHSFMLERLVRAMKVRKCLKIEMTCETDNKTDDELYEELQRVVVGRFKMKRSKCLLTTSSFLILTFEDSFFTNCSFFKLCQVKFKFLGKHLSTKMLKKEAVYML